MAAVELVADKEEHENFPAAAKIGGRLIALMQENGVIGRVCPIDSLVFSPPLIISKPEIDDMLDRVSKSLDTLTVQLRREKIAAVA